MDQPCVERDLFGQNVIANVGMTSPPKIVVI